MHYDITRKVLGGCKMNGSASKLLRTSQVSSLLGIQHQVTSHFTFKAFEINLKLYCAFRVSRLVVL